MTYYCEKCGEALEQMPSDSYDIKTGQQILKYSCRRGVLEKKKRKKLEEQLRIESLEIAKDKFNNRSIVERLFSDDDLESVAWAVLREKESKISYPQWWNHTTNYLPSES